MRRRWLNGRHSTRLVDHDYTSAATYFVTICTYERLCWFGDVFNDRCVLSRAGEIVDEIWRSLPTRFEQVCLGTYIVMPNHVHGLLRFKSGECSLGDVVRAFKASSSRLIRNEVDEPFGWHRNYHEHRVRDDRALARIREYIQNNPRSWESYVFHPGPLEI